MFNSFELPQEDWNEVGDDFFYPCQVDAKQNPQYISGEAKLLEAVLWNSLEDLRVSFQPLTATLLYKEGLDYRRNSKKELLDWFYTEDPESGYSFHYICDYFKLNIEATQKELDKLVFQWSYNSGTFPYFTWETSISSQNESKPTSKKLGHQSHSKNRDLLRVKARIKCKHQKLALKKVIKHWPTLTIVPSVEIPGDIIVRSLEKLAA